MPVVARRGSAGDFHALALPDPVRLEVWTFDVVQPAVALGSGQPADVVDELACRREGVGVVRRRSGGGAVLLEPGAIVWFDVVVPARRLAVDGVGDDVGRSMEWLGDRIGRALTELGVDGVAVHRGSMQPSPWSALVCFAGRGRGEVAVASEGAERAKLVGVSQRRTRTGSRFQCAVHVHWSPARLCDLLAAHPDPSDLAPVATLPDDIASALPAAVARSLAVPLAD